MPKIAGLSVERTKAPPPLMGRQYALGLPKEGAGHCCTMAGSKEMVRTAGRMDSISKKMIAP
jgi:hypothetical protein